MKEGARIAFRDVERERRAQDLKWGEQNHDPATWLAILTEEVGEVAKEIADGSPVAAVFDHRAYRMELVQTAAVVVAAIESLDRQRA